MYNIQYKKPSLNLIIKPFKAEMLYIRVDDDDDDGDGDGDGGAGGGDDDDEVKWDAKSWMRFIPLMTGTSGRLL